MKDKKRNYMRWALVNASLWLINVIGVFVGIKNVFTYMAVALCGALTCVNMIMYLVENRRGRSLPEANE